MVLAALHELKQEGLLPERQRQNKLTAYLEQLEIVRHQKLKWILIAPKRLEKLIKSVRAPAHISTTSVLRKMPLIHHKTAAAWRGDSKTNKSCPLIAGQVVTTDEVLRLRSFNTSFKLFRDGKVVIDADEETRIRTEVLIPQRMMLDISQVSASEGTLLVTVENLGAFVDFPVFEGVLLIYSPGQDFSAVARLINKYFDEFNWVHFPDLDPNGIKIAEQMASALGRESAIWFPSFWEQARRKSMIGSQKVKWSAIEIPSPLCRLARNEQWVEQEVLVADQRFEKAIDELLIQIKLSE
jgi:hypothetical protein